MKWTAVLAWIVILLVAAGIPAIRTFNAKSPDEASEKAHEPIDLPFTMQGKYLFGVTRLTPEAKAQTMPQIDALAKSPLQQVAAAALAGEVEGRQAAVDRLAKLESPEASALRDWYVSQTPLPAETVARLGWFARLAQVIEQPDNAPARETVIKSGTIALIAMMCLFGAIAVAGVLGFGLLVTAIILLALGKLRFRTLPPLGPAHVYVESFAIYLFSFLAGSIVISLYFKDSGMLMHVVPFVFGIALAVAWPVLRGVRFSTQRADWGMHFGSSPFLEPIYGVMGYFAGLPIVACALGITVLLSRVFDQNVSHPIANEVTEQPLLMFLLAAVFAPLTEELLFRGAFVSHLRGWTGVVWSSVVSGFIFAAIHPQGWAAIPVLMSIGAVFALIRQWRDSLIPSITAHALNNGVLVGFMIVMAGT